MQCQPLLAHDAKLRHATPANVPNDRERDADERHDTTENRRRNNHRAHGEGTNDTTLTKRQQEFSYTAQVKKDDQSGVAYDLTGNP